LLINLLYLVCVEAARRVSGLMVIGRIISRGVVPIVSVEGSYTGARSPCIIIGKLSNRKEIILIIYLFVYKGSKPYFKLLVKDLYLPVGRRIEYSAHPYFNADELKELLLDNTSEA